MFAPLGGRMAAWSTSTSARSQTTYGSTRPTSTVVMSNATGEQADGATVTARWGRA